MSERESKIEREKIERKSVWEKEKDRKNQNIEKESVLERKKVREIILEKMFEKEK